jgi:hypothetical protein
LIWFRFAIPVHVWRLSPSNPYIFSGLCSVYNRHGQLDLYEFPAHPSRHPSRHNGALPGDAVMAR